MMKKKSKIIRQPDGNLAMELVRVTEAAAISAARFMGTGDKIGGDGAGGRCHAKIFENCRYERRGGDR